MKSQIVLRHSPSLRFPPAGLVLLLALTVAGCSSVAPERPGEVASPVPLFPALEKNSDVVLRAGYDNSSPKLRSLAWDRAIQKRTPHLGELLPPPPIADWQLLGETADLTPLSSQVKADQPNPSHSVSVSSSSHQARRTNDGNSRPELKRLESAFLGALMNLFGRGGGRSSDSSGGLNQNLTLDQQSSGLEDAPFENPFEEALAEQLAEALPPPEVAQENPAPPVETAESTPPPLVPQGGAQVRSPVETVEEIPEGPFRFVVAGDLEDSEPSVFRAIKDEDGYFVLENYTRYSLNTAFLTFWEEERVLTRDLDRDGTLDIAVVRPGGELEVLHGRGGVKFQDWASLPVPDAAAISAFELTGDDDLDLVVALTEDPHLAVYQQAAGGFGYQRELVLPFQPGFLLPGTGDSDEPLLFVFDSQISQVVALGEGSQGLFQSAPAGLLEGFRGHEVSLQAGDEGVQSLRLGEHVALARRTADGLSVVGSFKVGTSAPLVILGDNFSTGSAQLLIVP